MRMRGAMKLEDEDGIDGPFEKAIAKAIKEDEVEMLKRRLPSALPLLAEVKVDNEGGWGFVSAVQGALDSKAICSLDDFLAGANFDTPNGPGSYLVKPEYEEGDENNESGWYCTLVEFLGPFSAEVKD